MRVVSKLRQNHFNQNSFITDNPSNSYREDVASEKYNENYNDANVPNLKSSTNTIGKNSCEQSDQSQDSRGSKSYENVYTDHKVEIHHFKN